jgi:uncharacterized protein (TIGR02246 family)
MRICHPAALPIAFGLAMAAILLQPVSAAAQPAQAETSHQEAAVEALFMDGIAAFNRHDLDVFLRQFAPDIAMYTPTGWLRGGDAVRERFVWTLANFPTVRIEIENLKARQVGADTMVVDFNWRTFPRGEGPAFHGVGSGVYVQRAGRWVEVLEHETVVRIDPGATGPR